MLASDMNNPNFLGPRNPDEVLHVTFYMRSIQNEFESEKQGRPIFQEVPFVKIMTPGNQLNIVDTPVRPDHRLRFPRQWEIFQSSQSQEQVIGTPVDQWPRITRAQAEEIKALKFFTVEQIAGASDQQVQKLGMNAQMLRQEAQAFLAKAKDTALEQKQAADLKRKDDQIEELQKSIRQLSEKMQELQKPKRKYTKRQEVVEEASA